MAAEDFPAAYNVRGLLLFQVLLALAR
jgi:hypothetical protein